MYTRIRFLAPFLLLIAFAVAQPQDKKPTKDPTDKSRLTFRLPVNVIVVNATVSDKKGNPVRDLVQSDFKVYEDGQPQSIQTFAVESYEPENSAVLDNAIPPVSARENRPRMISLMIDDITATSREDFPRVIDAAKKLVEEDMRPEDQIAVTSASGRVQFPFTGDRQALLEELKTVLSKLAFSRITREDCPVLTDLQAHRISRDEEAQDFDFNAIVEETVHCLALETDPNALTVAKNYVRMSASRQAQESEYRSGILLQSLRQHLRFLKHFDAGKALILFSGGFLSQGISQIFYGLQDVVDQALASGVIFNTIDSRGLYTAITPASERPISSASLSASYRQTAVLDDLSAREAPLAQLAYESGGLFFHNNNDMHDGIKRVIRRNSFYYVLTYAMPSRKSDGGYHQIKVEVARPGVELSYRKGYYAPKEQLTFERRKKEDILEALRAPGNLNEIRIGLAYNYYQEDASTYSLALSSNVSIRGLHFLEENSRRKNLINLVVALFDETDRYVDGIEKIIDFKLREESYSNILQYGINSKVEFKVPMGRYKVKAVVRDGAEAKMGSVTRVVEIP